MKKLKGAVAVVTGAGSGIGRATSLELARRGCDLALVDISEGGALETAAMVREFGRDGVVGQPLVQVVAQEGGHDDRDQHQRAHDQGRLGQCGHLHAADVEDRRHLCSPLTL